MNRYEYKMLHFRANMWSSTGLPEDLNVKFDELGAAGWEYLEMKPLLSGGLFFLFIGYFTRTNSMVAVFRRPLP